MHYTAGTTMSVVRTTMSVVRTTVWTRAKCPRVHTNPNGHNIVMSLPGLRVIETRAIDALADCSGRGRVVKCHQCGGLVEVIEH